MHKILGHRNGTCSRQRAVERCVNVLSLEIMCTLVVIGSTTRAALARLCVKCANRSLQTLAETSEAHSGLLPIEAD